MTEENNAGGIAEMFAGIDFQKVVDALPEEDRPLYKDVKGIEEVFKRDTNGQRLIGKRNENSLPGEKATPEEWEKTFKEKVYKKIGGVDTPDDYDFGDVKLAEDRAKILRETFATNNLTKKQAAEVVKKIAELEKNHATEEETQMAKFQEDQLKERKLKYGENFERNNNLVDNAITKLAGENKDFAEALKLLSHDNQYFEMFRRVGDVLQGADPNGPADKNSGNKTLTTREQIDQILDPTTKSGKIRLGLDKNATQEQRAEVNNQLKELYRKLAEDK